MKGAATSGTQTDPAETAIDAPLVAALVGVIAAVALAMRWISAHESLFGDEVTDFANPYGF